MGIFSATNKKIYHRPQPSKGSVVKNNPKKAVKKAVQKKMKGR